MSKSIENRTQDEHAAPVLRVASSDDSNHLDEMLRQGRSMSGHERNCCFLNTLADPAAKNRFATVSAISGLDFADDGRAAAQVDWDHDGDPDLWLTNRNAPRLRFMRNDHPADHHFLQLRLIGNGSDTNRNAIGARVSVIAGGADGADGENADDADRPTRLIRTLRAGDGFLTQSSQWLHFGLGDRTAIARIEVRWPNASGEVEVFEALPVDGRYELVQGSGRARVVPPRQDSLALNASRLEVPAADPAMRIPLLHQLKAPPLGYYDFTGQPRDFPRSANQVTVVNLWSTTCQPCVKELSEFSERYAELQKSGVQVLALCIDELQSMPDARQAADAMATRLGFPFTAGMAPPTVVAELQRLHNALIKMERALPMPTSFLIDRNGRLDVIYKGRVDVDTLLADAAPRELDLLQRFARSAPFPGTVLDSAVVNGPMESNEASVLVKLARDYLKQGQLERSIATFEDALEQVPDAPAIHNELAILYDLQRKNDEALRYYRQALELKPESPALNVSIAQILIRQRKYDDAETHLQAALAIDADYADAHYNLGVVYSTRRDAVRERASYEQALETSPNHAQALYRLGRLFEQQQDWDQARAWYEKARDAAPRQAAVLTSLGRVIAVRGDVYRAEKLFREAIEYDPRYAEARFQLGRALMAMGNRNEARQQLLTTLQIERNHRGAIRTLQQLARGPAVKQ